MTGTPGFAGVQSRAVVPGEVRPEDENVVMHGSPLGRTRQRFRESR